MKPETRAMIDRVRELDKAVSEAEWKVAKLEPTGAGRALTEHTRAEAVRIDLEREEYFRTAAPALADALEAADRDKAKLVKVFEAADDYMNALGRTKDVHDLQREKGAPDQAVIRIGHTLLQEKLTAQQKLVKAINAAREVAEGAE